MLLSGFKPEAKKLLDDYAEELTGALKAFLMRQEFQITDMDAVGTLLPNKIQVAGGVSGPTPGFGAPIAGPALVGPATNINPVTIAVQISQTSNKHGNPNYFGEGKGFFAKIQASMSDQLWTYIPDYENLPGLRTWDIEI